MLNRPKSPVLLSFDGFGCLLERENNAIAMANAPCWDQFQKDYPMTLLDCSGHNAPKVTDHLVDAITGSKNDVIISNYANCYMVGHTGVIPAAILAVEAANKSLQRIVDALKPVCRRMLLTADHGNIEQMAGKETGQPYTAHTTNQVPLVYVGGDKALASGGGLSDLAPVILSILGVGQPVERTGRSRTNAA
ncbi:MAG: hypothetical protein ACU88J_01605 [Gammaproteobacteria bacterium]